MAEEEEKEEQKSFDSTAGVIFSCLGCVIGTGNVWRFPRIMARHSGRNGAAGFFVVWCVSLFTWSIPIMVIEYAVGRHLRISPIRVFHHFMGKIGMIVGGWLTFINFCVGAYYLVIVAWCVYYVIMPMIMELPSEEAQSLLIFNEFVQSNWPYIPYAICILVCLASVIGGISVIEKVNNVLVPILLVILLGIFFYSVSLKFSEYGFDFLFSADWATLKTPSIYVDAISQNAFDTGAGAGLIAAYAVYLTKDNSIMRYSLFIPLVNNYVSLIASMMIFPCVFGLMMTKNPTITTHAIIDLIKGGGVAGTGLTFIWVPILLQTMGVFGRVLCSIFFVCLTFAGISAFISMLEIQTITLTEFGLPRKYAVIIVCSATFLYGSISIARLNFLASEDNVWGYSLIVSGLLFSILVMKYGPLKFRSEIVNKEKSPNDFTLPLIWVFFIVGLVPIQAVVLLGWWIHSDIIEFPTIWYIPTWSTLMLTWIEWLVLLIILVIVVQVSYRLGLSWTKSKDGAELTDFRNFDSSKYTLQYTSKYDPAFKNIKELTGIENKAYDEYADADCSDDKWTKSKDGVELPNGTNFDSSKCTSKYYPASKDNKELTGIVNEAYDEYADADCSDGRWTKSKDDSQLNNFTNNSYDDTMMKTTSFGSKRVEHF